MRHCGEKDKKFSLGQLAEGWSSWAQDFQFQSIDDGEFLNVLNKETTC